MKFVNLILYFNKKIVLHEIYKILTAPSRGHVRLALQNEVGGTWLQEVPFVYVKKIGLCFWFLIIGLTPNRPQLLYFPKDSYKQKQCDTSPLRMMTDIMHFID